MSLQDLLAALGVIINGLPQGLLALSYGFAALPTSIAFFVGAAGALAFGLVAPISFQAETITLVGTMGKNRQERLSMLIWEGAAMTVIGLMGLLQAIVNFVGPAVTNGMMAGVGVVLTAVAVNMVREELMVGLASAATALLVYMPTKNLVYTIVASVTASTILANLLGKVNPVSHDGEYERFILQRPIATPRVLRGAAALMCLNIGANIAFGNITGSIANSSVNIDHLAIVSSLADLGSALFGGGPVESIISATGAAPHPVLAGALMMALMGVILVAGLLPRLGRYVPMQPIAGFLLVLGAIVTFPTNAKLAIAADPLVGGVTAAVTATTDPFLGMLAGVVMKYLIAAFGV